MGERGGAAVIVVVLQILLILMLPGWSVESEGVEIGIS